MTSPIVGPSATASENAKKGIPRFAFTEPSIGIDDDAPRPACAEVRSPSSSDTSTKSSPSAASRSTDGVLRRLVDRRRVVAADAELEHRLALDSRRQPLEYAFDVLDAEPTRLEPRRHGVTG